jgi:hypothetical protein
MRLFRLVGVVIEGEGEELGGRLVLLGVVGGVIAEERLRAKRGKEVRFSAMEVGRNRRCMIDEVADWRELAGEDEGRVRVEG